MHAALSAGDLVNGILIRGTLHLVSAREHPAYSAAAELSGTNDWRNFLRKAGREQPALEDLRVALHGFAAGRPRTGAQIGEFIEDWLAGHPGELDPDQLDWLRGNSFRVFLRTSCLLRVPADGRWDTAKAPAGHAAAPRAPITREGVPAQEALAEVVLRHLRAFGPATAEDTAYWLGFRPPRVRPVLESLGDRLVRFADGSGRVLYDLPDAPRPDPDTPAPIRLLPWFDSALLAYDAKRRARILPDAYRDVVYQKANLQLLPTVLIDGLVTGMWSLETRKTRGGSVCVVLETFDRPGRADRDALAEEAERLARFTAPEAASHTVRFDSAG